MLHLVRNGLSDPQLFVDAARWLGQKYLLRREPVRRRHGVRISSFVDFSEYFTFASGVSQAEFDFLASLDPG